MTFQKAFNQLAYNLIYPAVLGSIIFDLADPLRDFNHIKIASYLVCVCFIVDYLHMTLNLCKNGESKHAYGAVVDIIIALFFCFSFFSLSPLTAAKEADITNELVNYYSLCSLAWILAAQILIFWYDLPKDGEPPLNVADYLPVGIPVIGLLLIHISPSIYTICILISTLALLSISYICKVVKASKRNQLKD